MTKSNLKPGGVLDRMRMNLIYGVYFKLRQILNI